MSAEADAICGAPYGARSEDRVNSRNGYRPRDWDTRAGSMELAIPKLRSGSYFPDWLLEQRRRAERALTTVVATCYLLGVGPDDAALRSMTNLTRNPLQPNMTGSSTPSPRSSLRVDTWRDGHRVDLLQIGFRRSSEGSRDDRHLRPDTHAIEVVVHHVHGLNPLSWFLSRWI